MKPSILFAIDGFLLHFCLSYYLQSHLDAKFYALIDINSKPKKFFENQTLVKFEKNWFFHDHIKKTNQEPDLKYLSNIESKYGIDLWRHAINERFFYLHNRFYKFTKKEILSILEQELKLFESILDEINPDYFLTFTPVFHHQKLLQDMCRSKGIRVLSVYGTGIENKMILAEDGATFDLKMNSMQEYSPQNRKNSSNEAKNYDSIFSNYLTNRKMNFSNKLTALKDYLFNSDSELINSNFMYYGRTKFKVIKDAFALELKRKRNFSFLQKNSSLAPNMKIPFVYFPMNIVEELNLLHYAPFYTDQIEVIRHVAKSIPINYKLYVKEHGAAGIRGWNSIDYYKQIMEIPNVELIHPNTNNNTLLKNSKLVVTIRGTSALKAIKYGVPSIVFGDLPFQFLPSVFTVETIIDLPELIKTALNCKVNVSEYERYEKILGDRIFECNVFEYENKRDRAFFSGNILSNVPIRQEDMIQFLNENKTMLSGLVNSHLKIISTNADTRLNNQIKK